jgi:hypothetical protein
MPIDLELLIVTVLVALVKAWHYFRQRRRGYSHIDSLRPWPRRPLEDERWTALDRRVTNIERTLRIDSHTGRYLVDHPYRPRER